MTSHSHVRSIRAAGFEKFYPSRVSLGALHSVFLRNFIPPQRAVPQNYLWYSIITPAEKIFVFFCIYLVQFKFLTDHRTVLSRQIMMMWKWSRESHGCKDKITLSSLCSESNFLGSCGTWIWLYAIAIFEFPLPSKIVHVIGHIKDQINCVLVWFLGLIFFHHKNLVIYQGVQPYTCRRRFLDWYQLPAAALSAHVTDEGLAARLDAPCPSFSAWQSRCPSLFTSKATLGWGVATLEPSREDPLIGSCAGAATEAGTVVMETTPVATGVG